MSYGAAVFAKAKTGWVREIKKNMCWAWSNPDPGKPKPYVHHVYAPDKFFTDSTRLVDGHLERDRAHWSSASRGVNALFI